MVKKKKKRGQQRPVGRVAIKIKKLRCKKKLRDVTKHTSRYGRKKKKKIWF